MNDCPRIWMFYSDCVQNEKLTYVLEMFNLDRKGYLNKKLEKNLNSTHDATIRSINTHKNTSLQVLGKQK